MEIEALEIDTICNDDIPMPDDHIVRTMQEMPVDTRAICTQRSSEANISILIGSDHYWDRVTGNVKAVTMALKAVETLLGWTIQGLLPLGTNATHCASVIVLRASVQDNKKSKIGNRHWEFRSIGIKCDDKQHFENKLATTQFGKSIEKMNERPEIALPRKAKVGLNDNHAGMTMELHGL